MGKGSWLQEQMEEAKQAEELAEFMAKLLHGQGKRKRGKGGRRLGEACSSVLISPTFDGAATAATTC